MMQQPPKKFLKVSYLGETKRLKIVNDYATLVNLTRSAFKEQEMPATIKFYYLDEENEIISINSQSDLNEALDIEDLSSLKLTVAISVTEARKQLECTINANNMLAESLSQSQFLQGGLSSARSVSDNFQMIGGDELRERKMSNVLADVHTSRTQVTHEIGCGGDDLMKAVDIATDVNNLLAQNDAGVMTARTVTHEQAVGGNPIQMSSVGTQNIKATQDAGCESIKTQSCSIGSQMQCVAKDAEVSCEIIIPDDEDVKTESITCFKCCGSTVNKKGLPCRKCKGTGSISSKEINEVMHMVREEVHDYCTATFKDMFRDYMIKRKIDQNNQVFDTIVCDGCEMSPIKGIRFMCSVCSNYDLCENCERAGVHIHHPMLKIRRSDQAPSKLICQYKNNQEEEPRSKVPNAPDSKMKQSSTSKKDAIRFSGRFIKESFPDMFEVAPGTAFTKVWTMRNDGATAWPEDVLLIQTNGDNMDANPVPITAIVPANGEFDWSVDFKAPEQEGKYTAYFRMTFGDNIRFGHKIWCSILVKKPVVAMCADLELIPKMQAQESVEKSQFQVEENDDDLYEEVKLADKSGEAPKIEVIDKKMENLSLSSVFQTPKEIYMQAVELETDVELKSGLQNLYDFGFVEFKVNKALLQKYENQVNTVAEILLNGALNESTYQKIFAEENK